MPSLSFASPCETTVIVHGVRSGDFLCRNALVRRFSPLLRSLIMMRLGRKRAQQIEFEDVIAETWMIVLDRMVDLRHRNGRITPVFMRFLTMCLYNVTNNHLRQASRRLRSRSVRDETHHLDAVEAESSLRKARESSQTRELAEELCWSLERMEPVGREIILKRIEGFTNTEIAAATGSQPNTVAQRLHRALRTLWPNLPTSFRSTVQRALGRCDLGMR